MFRQNRSTRLLWHKLIIISLLTALFGSMILPHRAQAWKPTTHVFLGDVALKDAVVDGLVTINRVNYRTGEIIGVVGQYAVDPAILQGLRNNPAQYHAGILGPDAYPDIMTGQQVIHPGQVDTGVPMGSNAWLRHLWNQSEIPSNRTPAIKAFTVGYMTHAAGDMFGHTFINNFSGGHFALGENAIKHIVLEGYVDKRLDKSKLDANFFRASIDGVEDFIYRSLIDARPGTHLGETLLREGGGGTDKSLPRIFSSLRRDLLIDIEENRAAADDCKVYDPTCSATILNAIADYEDRWVDDIDSGLRAWPGVSHQVAIALFFNAERKADTDKAFSILQEYVTGHLLSMAGAPDAVGIIADKIGDLIDTVTPSFLKEAISELKGALLDVLLEAAIGMTKEELKKYLTNPELHFDLVMSIGAGEDVTLQRMNSEYLHLTDTGYNSPNESFDYTQVPAAYNTATMSKLIMLGPNEINRLLSDLGSDVRLDGPNVMLGFIPSLDGSAQWLDGMVIARDSEAYRQIFMLQAGETPLNGRPTANADGGYETPADTRLEVTAPGLLANDSDPEGSPLMAALATESEFQSQLGTVTVSPDGAFTYEPNGQEGIDQFGYYVTDGFKKSKVALVQIKVAPGNEPPYIPRSPIPSDNRLASVSTSLYWIGGDPNPNDVLNYFVFLRPLGGDSERVCVVENATKCDLPSDLEYATTYEWGVDAYDDKTVTGGPTWSFTTYHGLSLEVDISTNRYRDPGEVIEFTYTIHNGRNIPIDGPIAVVDTLIGTIPSCGTTPLAAGASTTCTAEYTVQASDTGPNKAIRNTAYATYDGAESSSDSSIALWDNPTKVGLEIEADPLVYSNEGDEITYTYKIINIGELPLTGPFSVNHRHLEIGTIDPCGDAATLEPGEQTGCQATYTITRRDLDGSEISSEASAAAQGSGIGTSGFTRIKIEEEARRLKFHIDYSPFSFSDIGDVISYTYSLTNTSNVPLPGPFKVQIDGIGAAFDPCGSGPLEIGESTSCNNSYEATQRDVDRGSTQVHSGRASSSGVSSERFEVTVPGADENLLFSAQAAPTYFAEEGETIVYQYTITNTGGMTLTGPLVVLSDIHEQISCEALGDEAAVDLGPGAVASCSGTWEITQEDLSRGEVAANAAAQAQDATSNNVRSTVYAGSGALALTATVTPKFYDTVGETISFEYTIENLSDRALNAPFTVAAVQATDPITNQAGTASSCGGGQVAPNATTSCTVLHTITQDDLDSGSIGGTVYAYGDGATAPNVGSTAKAKDSSNQAPTAAADQATTNQGVATTIDVTTNDSDPESDPLDVTIDTQPANGMATLNNGQIVYTPNEGFTGQDIFIYSVTDTNGSKTSAAITVSVVDPNAPNQQPTAADDEARTDLGVAVTINVAANDNDADGDTLGVTINTQPANGTAMVSNNQVVYTPAAGFADLDSFTYDADDGRGGRATATVTVLVVDPDNPNRPPTTADDTATTEQDIAVTINVTANDSDEDGDSLTLTILSQPENGTATVSNGQIVYTPKASFSGEDGFTYRVDDGKGRSATAAVTISVSADETSTTKSLYLPLVSNPNK